MSTETMPEQNKYVTHFNAVVSNYVETFLVPDRKEFHAQTAHSLDVLMREYAQATELLDWLRGKCWTDIEIAKNAGRDYEAVARVRAAQYPLLAVEIREFVDDLESTP